MFSDEVPESFCSIDQGTVSAHPRHHDDVTGPIQGLHNKLTLQRTHFVIVRTDSAEDLWIVAHDIHVNDWDAFCDGIIDLSDGRDVRARNDANDIHLVCDQIFHL